MHGVPAEGVHCDFFHFFECQQGSIKGEESLLFDSTVVFDEFHYMNDPDRGTVWEESIISCPLSVRVLALSATMGNVADIKGWMDHHIRS